MLKRFAKEAVDVYQQSGHADKELEALRFYKDVVEKTASGELKDLAEDDPVVLRLFDLVDIRPKVDNKPVRRRGRKKKSEDLQLGNSGVGNDSGGQENI